MSVNTGVSAASVCLCLWSRPPFLLSPKGAGPGVSIVLRGDKIVPKSRYVGTQRAAQSAERSPRGDDGKPAETGSDPPCVCVSVFLQPVGDLLCGVGERCLDVRRGEKSVYSLHRRLVYTQIFTICVMK